MSSKVTGYKNGLRAFLAFGNWNNGSSAGPAALHSNNAPSNAYSHIATRSALDKSQKRKHYGACDSAPSNGLRALSIALEYGWHALFSSNVERQSVRHA